MKICFIPIDNRPVCYNLAKDICAVDEDITLYMPPKEFLGGLKKYADTASILKWLDTLPQFDVMIVSLDTVAYGGLIPSRRIKEDFEAIKARIECLKPYLKNKKVYAFSSIMRISNNNYNFNYSNEIYDNMRREIDINDINPDYYKSNLNFNYFDEDEVNPKNLYQGNNNKADIHNNLNNKIQDNDDHLNTIKEIKSENTIKTQNIQKDSNNNEIVNDNNNENANDNNNISDNNNKDNNNDNAIDKNKIEIINKQEEVSNNNQEKNNNIIYSQQQNNLVEDNNQEFPNAQIMKKKSSTKKRANSKKINDKNINMKLNGNIINQNKNYSNNENEIINELKEENLYLKSQNEIMNVSLLQKDQIIESLNNRLKELEMRSNANYMNNQDINMDENEINNIIMERDELFQQNQKLALGINSFNERLKEISQIYTQKNEAFIKEINFYKNKLSDYKRKIIILKRKIDELHNTNRYHSGYREPKANYNARVHNLNYNFRSGIEDDFDIKHQNLTPNRFIKRTPKINFDLGIKRGIENNAKMNFENDDENNLQKEQKKFVEDYKIFLRNLGK